MGKISGTSGRNLAYKRNMENSPIVGVYLGEVTSTKDLSRSGKLQVFIAALAKDKTSSDGLFDCFWSSPFAGSTNPSGISQDIKDYKGTQKTYGMWMVPPDIGNLVLVAFADNNPKFPYVISCVFPNKLTHMVPGMPAGKSYGDPNMLVPVAEKNRRDAKTTHNDAIRPMHVDLAEAITKQGLINDQKRGAGSSGSRREAPSEVFGILTPGRKDPTNPNHRSGGHQFVMDDNLNSSLIRLRTAGGTQLLLDDTGGSIYMINKPGTAWFEMTQGGDFNFYGNKNFNVRVRGNFNIRAEQDVNIEAGQSINLHAAKDNIAGTDHKGTGKGSGGDVKITAQNGIDVSSVAGIRASSAEGDIALNSAGKTIVTAGIEIPNPVAGINIIPAGIELKSFGAIYQESAFGGIHLSSKLGMIGLTALGGFAIINAPQILLNSGPSLPVNLGPAPKAAEVALSDKKDNPLEEPKFNREAAIKGETGIPGGGLREGKQDKIKTIVTEMLTSEPYRKHSQFDPIKASETADPQVSQDVLDALPQSAVDLSGKPADVNTPDGFSAGNGYLDQAGNALTDFSQAIGDTSGAIGALTDSVPGAGALADAIPSFSDLGTGFGDFQLGLDMDLLGFGNLESHLDSLKAALPTFNFPVSNFYLDLIIGINTILKEYEARMKQFALTAKGLSAALNSTFIESMNNKIKDAKSKLNSLGGLANLQGEELDSFVKELADAGINVTFDGPSIIYEDAAGNKIVDFSNGVGEVAATLGAVRDMGDTFESIKASIVVPMSQNQALAITDFAKSIGVEKFLTSNVLEALNKGQYSEVPRYMQSWILGVPPGGDTGVPQDHMIDLRNYQSALFQTPDGADYSEALENMGSGTSTFTGVAEQIDNARARMIAYQLSTGG